MKKFLSISLFIIVSKVTVVAQSKYGVTVTAPQPNTVNLSSGGDVSYIARTEVILSAGFEVTYSGNTTSSNYFLAAIETEILNTLVPTYSPLEKELSSGYAITYSDKLYFKYDEKYRTGYNLNYKVYSYDRTIFNAVSVPVVSMGEAYYELNINTLLTGFSAASQEQFFFILEVTNDKNEKYYLRFKYLPTT